MPREDATSQEKRAAAWRAQSRPQHSKSREFGAMFAPPIAIESVRRSSQQHACLIDYAIGLPVHSRRHGNSVQPCFATSFFGELLEEGIADL